jgi:hypothetical protein
MPTTSSAGSAHHGAGYTSMPEMTSIAPSAPATSQDPAFWAVLDALLN